MTVVTIKKVNRRTSFSRAEISNAVKAAIAIHGKPKTAVVKVELIKKVNSAKKK